MFFKNISISIISFSIVLISLACMFEPGKSKNRTIESNKKFNYTQNDLIGIWEKNNKKFFNIKTYTFYLNGNFMFTEDISYPADSTSFIENMARASGTFSISNNNLTLNYISYLVSGSESGTKREVFPILIKDNTLSIPAMQILSLGSDGYGPEGKYKKEILSTFQFMGKTITNKVTTELEMLKDETFIMKITDSNNNTISESGTWQNIENNTFELKTTFVSDDPEITEENYLTNEMQFIHYDDTYIMTEIFTKK